MRSNAGNDTSRTARITAPKTYAKGKEMATAMKTKFTHLMTALLAVIMVCGLTAPAYAISGQASSSAGVPEDAGSAIVEKDGGVYVMNNDDNSVVEFYFDKASLGASVVLHTLDYNGAPGEDVTVTPILIQSGCQIVFPGWDSSDSDYVGSCFSWISVVYDDGRYSTPSGLEWWFTDNAIETDERVTDSGSISGFTVNNIRYWVKLADDDTKPTDTVTSTDTDTDTVADSNPWSTWASIDRYTNEYFDSTLYNAGSAVIEKDGGVYVMSLSDSNAVAFYFDKACLGDPIAMPFQSYDNIGINLYTPDEMAPVTPILIQPGCQIVFSEPAGTNTIGRFRAWSSWKPTGSEANYSFPDGINWSFKDSLVENNSNFKTKTIIYGFLANDISYWVRPVGDDVDPANTTANSSTANSYSNSYDDVLPGDWYYDAVMALSEGGLFSGYGNGKFGPNDIITYGQFQLVMSRLTGGKAYGDESAIDLGTDINKMTMSRGLTAVCLVQTFNAHYSYDYYYCKTFYNKTFTSVDDFPDSEDIRAWVYEYLTVIQPALGIHALIPNMQTSINAVSKNFILKAYKIGMFRGVDDKETFAPYHSLTRAQFCQILYNMGCFTADCPYFNC